MKNIKSIKTKDNLMIEATFYSGAVKLFDVSSLFDKHPEYKVLQTDTDLWNSAKLFPQGSGVYFNDDLDLTVEEIWNNGKLINTVSVEPKYAIAYAITKAREEMGLSQSELSKLTGVTQCDISRIEGAVSNPTLETITKLCKILCLDVSLLKAVS